MTPLYFLHIAKTAGTSLIHFLDGQFPKDQIAPFSLTHELAAALKKDPQCLEKYALLHGHLGYSPVTMMKQKPQIITLLREPVARTLSHYRHILRHKDHWLFADLPKKSLSLEEFLDYPPAQRLVTNFQTRNLAQDFDFTKPIAEATGKALQPNLGRLLSFVRPALSEDNLLNVATERLAAMDLVGTTETFDTFVTTLCKQRGWAAPATTLRHNTAPAESLDSLAPATRKKIEALTALDRVLYRAAGCGA